MVFGPTSETSYFVIALSQRLGTDSYYGPKVPGGLLTSTALDASSSRLRAVLSNLGFLAVSGGFTMTLSRRWSRASVSLVARLNRL